MCLSDNSASLALGFSGVGITLNARAKATLIDWIHVNCHLCIARFGDHQSNILADMVLATDIGVLARDLNAQVW